MEEDLKSKLYKNQLVTDNLLKHLVKIDPFERQKIVLELLKDSSNRLLAKEIGVSATTINDWKTLRILKRDYTSCYSFGVLYTKLCSVDPEKITDWGRIQMIKDKCEDLLRLKGGL